MNYAFHVFTHNQDIFTQDILCAVKTYRRFKRDNKCARLYIEIFETADTEGEPAVEDCLASYGTFPS